MAHRFDFSGWATRNNLKCTDGRIICRDAFKDNDCTVVPLIWQHDHSTPSSVIGHALLENRKEGVYAYCSVNDTQAGVDALKAVKHGDLEALSIYANGLTQNGPNVIHGNIREVSLVMHGANPGAYIDNVIAHSDGSESYGEEGFIYNDEIIDSESELYLCHDENGDPYISENPDDDESGEGLEHADKDRTVKDVFDTLTEEQKIAVYYIIGAIQNKEDDDSVSHADSDDKDKTVEDVFNTLTEEQKTAVYYIIGKVKEEAESGNKSTTNKEDESEMKHNVFDNSDSYKGINSADPNVIQHGEALRAETSAMFAEAFKKQASLRDTIIAHAATYGIDDIDFLFPDAKTLTNEPEFISRNMDWVSTFLNGVKRSPFSRIKTIFADITEDAARAKGYVKGALKIEEVFKLLKRITNPTTVYKKQALDRDDAVDITSFDVAAYMRKEMRIMLNEEIATACLIGDGRDPVSQARDKIDEDCIRPIYTDADLYSIKVAVAVGVSDTDEAKAKNLIKAVIKARKNYKGSGNPIFFCTEDVLSDLLLVEDGIGRRLYKTKEELATALLCRSIETVEAMANKTRTVGEGQAAVVHTLAGIMVNPIDYVIGADKGGEINTWDDFDIDYNKMKYLMETRCSGCLVKPYSAMVVEFVPAAG